MLATKSFKTIIRGLVLLLAISIMPAAAHADSLDSFDATIHPSEHQKDKDLLYYDLQYQPNESEQLTVTLTNRTDKPVKLKLSFNRAITNNIGVVEYSGMNKDTSNFGPNITDHVKLSDTDVDLPANGAKDIYLDVNMPEKSFDGVLSGGLYIEELSDEKVEGNVKNVFSREIAVLLHNNNETVKPDLKITKAVDTQSNARNAIITTIDNKKSTYVKNATISYEVEKDGKIIAKDKKKQQNIAPSSRFPFLIQMDNTEFTPGTYKVKLTISADDQKWTGDPTFTINQEKATDYNKKDVSIEKETISPWVWIGGIVIVLLVALIIFMYLRNKKLKKKLDGK